MRPSNQFLIHRTVHPSNPYLSNLGRRMLWGTVVMNLIFPYTGRDFTPLVPNMLSIDSGRKPFLLFSASLAKFSSNCTLAFPTPSLHKQAASLYSSQVTCPCFHCLHAGFFPSLPDFLHLGPESSCALWKASLKICQLCSAPLSLRAVSQGILLTNSLKSWKFAFLKFRVLTILLACPISLRTVNSTNAASSLDVADELTCIGDNQVQYRIPLAQDPPAQPLEPSLLPRDTRSLTRLRDMAATFLFADSSTNKAEHRHTHTEDTDMAGHTDCRREGAAFDWTYIRDSHKTQAQAAKSLPPLGLAETEGVHLQFVNFSTETIHDYLEVRSGSTETSTVIGRLSGPQLPASLFSTTHETSLYFHSDYSQNKQGFHIVYQGEILTFLCENKVAVEAYQLQSCPDPRPFRNGFVIGNDFTVGQTISFECFPGYTLIGNSALTCLHGISRNWNHPLPRCEALCGGNITAMNGTIYSPGYPDEYPNFQDCFWLVRVPPGNGIYINFTVLQTEPIYDFITVWDGPDQTSPQIGQFSGNTALESVYSTSNQILIKFHSDFTTSGFFVLSYHAYQLRVCQPPTNIPNAEILTEDDEFEIGDIIRYQCQPGFTLVGNEILTCRLGERLQMDGAPPTCQVLCPANEMRLDSTGVILSPGYPDSYPNLQMCAWTITVEKGYNISMFFEFFQTEKEFDILEVFDGPNSHSPLLISLSGDYSSSLNITSNGHEVFLRWSADHGTNKKGFRIRYIALYCSTPESPPHGFIVSQTGGQLNSMVRWACDRGFRLVGKSTAVCRKSPYGYYSWDVPVPACQAISCGIPKAPLNGGILTTDYLVGTRVTYFCNDGYRLSAKELTTAVCQPDGTWSNHNKTPRCVVVTCPSINSFTLEHGRWRIVNGSHYEYKTKVVFSCDPGYYGLGPASIECLANGTWSWRNERPYCQIISCGELPTPPNGNKIGTQITYGSTAIFTCDSGYMLVGSAVRECLSSGLWSGIETRCLGMDTAVMAYLFSFSLEK
ncbi:hypothetical protein QYF61_022791, partial [Mycteria americana]